MHHICSWCSDESENPVSLISETGAATGTPERSGPGREAFAFIMRFLPGVRIAGTFSKAL